MTPTVPNTKPSPASTGWPPAPMGGPPAPMGGPPAPTGGPPAPTGGPPETAPKAVPKPTKILNKKSGQVKSKVQIRSFAPQKLQEDEDDDDGMLDIPLTKFEERVLGSCAVALLVVLVVLTCWSAGLLAPSPASISFSRLSGEMVGHICKVRPPLSVENLMSHNQAMKEAFDKLVCLCVSVFYIRYGQTNEKPMDVKCKEDFKGPDLMHLQNIGNYMPPLEVCKERFINTTLVCKKGAFEIDLICSECNHFASAVRLNLLYDRMFDLYHRGWFSPRTSFTSKGIVVAFDTELLALLFQHAGRNRFLQSMQTALILAENLAVQDLTRPWHVIELHAFNLSGMKRVQSSHPLDLGFMKMSTQQFYWMLRIENYCANRYPIDKRTSSDEGYEIYLSNILRILEVNNL